MRSYSHQLWRGETGLTLHHFRETFSSVSGLEEIARSSPVYPITVVRPRTPLFAYPTDDHTRHVTESRAYVDNVFNIEDQELLDDIQCHDIGAFVTKGLKKWSEIAKPGSGIVQVTMSYGEFRSGKESQNRFLRYAPDPEEIAALDRIANEANRQIQGAIYPPTGTAGEGNYI